MTTTFETNVDNRLLHVLGEKNANSKKNLSDLSHQRKKVLRGYSFDAFESAVKEIGLSQKQLSLLVGITESTLTRRKRERQPLTTVESDRLYRVARIAALAFEVFGDENKARIWMKRPNDVLDGEIPINLLETEIGAKQVEDELHRIFYGIYT